MPVIVVYNHSLGTMCFWCPGCDQAHCIPTGKPEYDGGPCWQFNGNREKPTFSPSINYPDYCHSFVRDGMIEFLGDCSHELAGQTVPLPEWTEQ